MNRYLFKNKTTDTKILIKTKSDLYFHKLTKKEQQLEVR